MMYLTKLTGLGLVLTGLAACGGGGQSNFSSFVPEEVPVTLVSPATFSNLDARAEELLIEDLRFDVGGAKPIQGSANYAGIIAIQDDVNFNSDDADRENNIVRDADILGNAQFNANFQNLNITGKTQDFYARDGSAVSGDINFTGLMVGTGRSIDGNISGTLTRDGATSTVSGDGVGRFYQEDVTALRIGVSEGRSSNGDEFRLIFLADKAE